MNRVEVKVGSGSAFKLFIESKEVEGVAVLRCSGRICFRREAEFLASIAERWLENGRDLLLDLAGVEALDSAGIGQLVLIYMRAEGAGRDVALCCAPDHVLQLLRLTNTAGLFERFDSVESALESRAGVA